MPRRQRKPFAIDMRSGPAHPHWDDLPANEWHYAGALMDGSFAMFEHAERFGETASYRHAMRVLGHIDLALVRDDADLLRKFESAMARVEDRHRARAYESGRRREWGPNVVDLLDWLRKTTRNTERRRGT